MHRAITLKGRLDAPTLTPPLLLSAITSTGGGIAKAICGARRISEKMNVRHVIVGLSRRG
jgi:hypothetical protein